MILTKTKTNGSVLQLYLFLTWMSNKWQKKVFGWCSLRWTNMTDYILASISKDFNPEIALTLTVINNMSIQEDTVPDDCRHANLTAIYIVSSCIDILLMTVKISCCKLLEHAIVSNTVKHIEKRLLTWIQDQAELWDSDPYSLPWMAASIDKKTQTDKVILDFSKALTVYLTSV